MKPSPVQEILVPVAPLRDGPIFPHTETVLVYGRARAVAAVKAAYTSTEKLILVISQKNKQKDDPEIADLSSIGTLCHIKYLMQTNGEVNVVVRGIARVELLDLMPNEAFTVARVVSVAEIVEQSEEITALSNHLSGELQKAAKLGKGFDFMTFMHIISGLPPAELSDQVASILDLKPDEKQMLLEEQNVKQRLIKINEFLARELKILELEKKLSAQAQQKFDKGVKEAILRERKKAIEKELGEQDEETKEFSELEKGIKTAGMPKNVQDKAEKELKKLRQMSQFNPEAGYIRNFLDWLVEMPWSKASANNKDLASAEKTLDEDHYGLEKIKERVIEYLAVMRLKHLNEENEVKEDSQAPPPVLNDNSELPSAKLEKKEIRKSKVAPTILCFVGPPGVGKTSIGKSIARALGREFVRVSLGGIRDEAEIRGHRRTYVGALPGRIIQGIKQAGTKNPVFMLDEIDKVGNDFRGDPSAALLEALDPEQNYAFSDHYLEVPFDLSDVMFITTANILETIPPALKDRLEIISFPGYTEEEKFHIAKDYLWKKQIEANGLKPEQVEMEDKALRLIIQRYTREAGVRNLERQISKVLRKVARTVAENKPSGLISLTAAKTAKYLGPYKFSATIAEKKDEIGFSTGLAWTEAGGDILFIEVAIMPGKGNLVLTGHLGEVMQESMKAASSYVRSRWKALGLEEKFYQKIDIHVHVPEGAVPKDGPSAGIAITSAIVSALTKIPVKREVGMTGEVTLRGRVLEIGGVKEKVIAAHRAGLKTIIMPRDNKKDLEDIPKYVLKDLKFEFVEHMDEVLKVALAKLLKTGKITERETVNGEKIKNAKLKIKNLNQRPKLSRIPLYLPNELEKSK